MAQPKIAVSNEIKIEKDVPFPERGLSRGRRYPFGDMEIGDSFEVVGAQACARLVSAASSYGTRNGKRFSIKTVRENGTPVSARVWRAA